MHLFYRDDLRVGKWLFVGVEYVNQILAPNIVASRVIVEFPSARYLFACFISEGVIIDDTVTVPFGVVSLLKKIKAFSVDLVFVPVVLCEEFV